MSLAVWLAAERKCSAATVVVLDVLLGLSMVRPCSLSPRLDLIG